MSSPLPYAWFEHPDGSWYRLWITHTWPKTQRGHPWHLHASYDKSRMMVPIARAPWFEQLYGMANWDFESEVETLAAFRERAAERLAHGYTLREGTIPAADASVRSS